MIDATHIGVHPHAAGARGENRDMDQRGLTSKIHLSRKNRKNQRWYDKYLRRLG